MTRLLSNEDLQRQVESLRAEVRALQEAVRGVNAQRPGVNVSKILRRERGVVQQTLGITWNHAGTVLVLRNNPSRNFEIQAVHKDVTDASGSFTIPQGYSVIVERFQGEDFWRITEVYGWFKRG